MKTLLFTLMLSVSLMASSNGKPNQSNGVVSSYMDLKDALVGSDMATAATAAGKLATEMEAANMDSKLVEAANTLKSSADLKAQRMAFKTVTDGLIAALKEKGTDQDIYVQFCPMAFNNTGANWLSLSQEVLNPYFGDMMLRCGKVQEKL